jgi:type IV pilus assembly protein PilA
MVRQLRSQKGVTLIELMVVVVILAIIAAIAITLYQDIQKKAKLASDQGTIAALRSAVAIYYGKNNGLFPSQVTLEKNLVVPAPPVWQCTGTHYTYTTSNGKIDDNTSISDC